jgi:hypothetical protein
MGVAFESGEEVERKRCERTFIEALGIWARDAARRQFRHIILGVGLFNRSFVLALSKVWDTKGREPRCFSGTDAR